MTKSEASWLVVRVGGIAACFAAVWHLCAAGYYVYVMASPQTDSGHGYFFAREAAFLEVATLLGYAIVAFYLLRAGRVVHRLLMRE